jgi:hypothetical protein
MLLRRVASLCSGGRPEVAAFRRQREEARRGERREEKGGRSTLELFAEQKELAERRKRLERVGKEEVCVHYCYQHYHGHHYRHRYPGLWMATAASSSISRLFIGLFIVKKQALSFLYIVVPSLRTVMLFLPKE